MELFVHVQGKPNSADQIAQAWRSAAEPVGDPGFGLYLISAEVYAPTNRLGQTTASDKKRFISALKRIFQFEPVEVGPWEYEVMWEGLQVNVYAWKEGVVLATKEGLLAAALLSVSKATESECEEALQLAVRTLGNAHALRPT